MPQLASRRQPLPPLAGVAGFLAIVLIACSTPGADRSTAGAVPANILDPLLDDAASRTGVARESITVAEAEAVTWTTGALGCPSPGVMYTQALVNGWRVILLVGEKHIDYRATGPGRFRVCEGILGG